ncbi:flagellar protein FlaG [Legionella sp. W05-934-2]|jgi:uncharacterized FlaG/YvyC family protein|uniref:flagellar protein FlaG n=1 Tax=Legionella sp. W05-934-2 TaxID=1198649 RepID=UPI003462952E
MDVSFDRSINSVSSPESQRVEKQQQTKPVVQSVTSLTDRDIQQAIDKATGLLQTIVTEKLSDEIIRKMPPDEYLNMLSLLDNIISGSVDESV